MQKGPQGAMVQRWWGRENSGGETLSETLGWTLISRHVALAVLAGSVTSQWPCSRQCRRQWRGWGVGGCMVRYVVSGRQRMQA